MEVTPPAAATPTNLPASEEVVKYLSRLKEWGVSVIRSVIVPPIAALVVLFLTSKVGLDINSDDPTLNTAIFVGVTALWYAAMRGIELVSRKPWFVKAAGILLGSSKAPASRVEPQT